MTRIPITYGPPHPDTAWLTSHGLARRRRQHSVFFYYRHVLLILATVGTVMAIVFWAGGSIRLP